MGSELARAAVEALAEAHERERRRRVRARAKKAAAVLGLAVSLGALAFGLAGPVAGSTAWGVVALASAGALASAYALAAARLRARWARIRRDARLSGPLDD